MISQSLLPSPSILWEVIQVHPLTYHFSSIHFNIILKSMIRFLEHSLLGFLIKILYTLLIFALHTTCTTYLNLLSAFTENKPIQKHYLQLQNPFLSLSWVYLYYRKVSTLHWCFWIWLLVHFLAFIFTSFSVLVLGLHVHFHSFYYKFFY